MGSSPKNTHLPEVKKTASVTRGEARGRILPQGAIRARSNDATLAGMLPREPYEQLRWSVVGVGIAGRARARAIQADPRARLVAVHRGRFAEEIGVPVLGLQEAVAEADVVAICSPNAAHAAQVRAVLEAGRHALVEFPLAESHAEAASLFELADAVDRVLHVEHIELLSGVTRVLLEQVRGVMQVDVEHSGPGAEVDGRRLGFANVARLHRLSAVVGPLEVSEVGASPGRMDATGVAGDVAVRLGFSLRPGLSRRTRMRFHTADGLWEQRDRAVFRDGSPVPLPEVGGLFLADQRVATARFLERSPGYVSRARILEVLELAETLDREARA